MFNSIKIFIHFVSKTFFMLCVLLGGVGCQSTLDIAGDEHKVVTEKWKALSKYADSDIENYGVMITARLAISADKKFKLTHFKISPQQTRQDINLLSPDFEYKYICSPMCYQLIEYVSLSGESGTTLLTSYFDRHEFELFKFYGDIQVLNKQLVKLAQYDQRLLNSYLISLAYQRVSFASAKEFIQFLTEALTMASLEGFADNPERLFFNFLKNYQAINGGQLAGVNHIQDEWTVANEEQDEWTSTNSEQGEWVGISEEQDEWTVAGEEQSKWTGVNDEQNEWTGIIEEFEQWTGAGQEQADWTTSTETPELVWSNKITILPEELWLKEASVQKQSTDYIETNNRKEFDNNQSAWQTAKASPIIVGHNVCSYQDSFFGVVAAISLDKITVNLLGQAKIINEGVVYPAREGDLFTLSEDLYFSPLTEKRVFEKSDVASCILE